MITSSNEKEIEEITDRIKERNAFEKAIMVFTPNADFSTVEGNYIQPRLQTLWEGWWLRQQFMKD